MLYFRRVRLKRRRNVMTKKNARRRAARPWTPAATVAGLSTATAAAFVPGQAEAHCGHGMYNLEWWEYNVITEQETYYNYGCIGKGATPSPEFQCTQWWGEQCIGAWVYYNCYSAC
jgi:hypothetical protein